MYTLALRSRRSYQQFVITVGAEVPENKKLLKTTPAVTDSLLRTPNLDPDAVRYNESCTVYG